MSNLDRTRKSAIDSTLLDESESPELIGDNTVMAANSDVFLNMIDSFETSMDSPVTKPEPTLNVPEAKLAHSPAPAAAVSAPVEEAKPAARSTRRRPKVAEVPVEAVVPKVSVEEEIKQAEVNIMQFLDEQAAAPEAAPIEAPRPVSPPVSTIPPAPVKQPVASEPEGYIDPTQMLAAGEESPRRRRLINRAVVARFQALNSLDADKVEQQLIEIHDMLSRWRQSTGVARDTQLLTVALALTPILTKD